MVNILLLNYRGKHNLGRIDLLYFDYCFARIYWTGTGICEVQPAFICCTCIVPRFLYIPYIGPFYYRIQKDIKHTFGFVEGNDPPGPIGTPPRPHNQKNKKKKNKEQK